MIQFVAHVLYRVTIYRLRKSQYPDFTSAESRERTHGVVLRHRLRNPSIPRCRYPAGNSFHFDRA